MCSVKFAFAILGRHGGIIEEIQLSFLSEISIYFFFLYYINDLLMV